MTDIDLARSTYAPDSALFVGSNPHQLLNPAPEFIELLPVAAYACDARGRVLWFNKRAEELWGRAPRLSDDSELFCGSYRLYFEGREVARDQTPMAHAIRTGEGTDGLEGIFERPDGSRSWVMVHIAPVRDGTGRIIGAINCFHDTTEKHRIAEALREKQNELEDFFENGAMPMHLVASDGTILRANAAELALLGYAVADYVGRNIRDFHADAETIADILERLARGERLERYPARLKAGDGSIRHVLITSSANIRDGKFINTRCITVDITEEVRAKEQIAETEERFRQLLEALPAAVYTTDAEGRITYYNKAAVEMSGREPELGTDKWCVTWKLYWPDGTPLPHDQCPMAIALRENRPVRNTEAMAERPDGTLVPFLPYPTPIRNRKGELVGAVNMLIDISERKQAEAHQMMLLKELNHRVKNNMQMLQALLGAAHRETTDPKARSLFADAIRRVAAMAAAQQVLHEEGKPTTFNARAFIEAVCRTAQSAFDERVELAIDCGPGVLSNDVAMPLALILNELLTNAVKHAVNGGVGTIRVAFAAGDGAYQLRVEDEGPGFAFDVGQRRSSGLGLVAGLARQIGGRFEVEPGPGARCVVRFACNRDALQ